MDRITAMATASEPDVEEVCGSCKDVVSTSK